MKTLSSTQNKQEVVQNFKAGQKTLYANRNRRGLLIASDSLGKDPSPTILNNNWQNHIKQIITL